MLRRIQTTLGRAARRAFFDNRPVSAMAVAIILFGPLGYWVASNSLAFLWALDLSLRTLFAKSYAVLGAVGLFWASILAGLIFYLLRQKSRALYATFELCFGAIVTSIAADSLYIHIPQSLTPGERFPLYTALLAALYVIVRGWDNLRNAIDTALGGTHLKSHWLRWPGKPSPQSLTAPEPDPPPP